MSIEYNPRDWYWRVAGSTAQVYSSKVGNYVSVDDATYVAWSAEPTHLTSNIASEAELGEVLAPYSLRPAASAANVLDGYKKKKSLNLTIEDAAKIFFNHENRLRVLEARPTVTANQFRSFLEDML